VKERCVNGVNEKGRKSGYGRVQTRFEEGGKRSTVDEQAEMKGSLECGARCDGRRNNVLESKLLESDMLHLRGMSNCLYSFPDVAVHQHRVQIADSTDGAGR
jgi:hypothetical protein